MKKLLFLLLFAPSAFGQYEIANKGRLRLSISPLRPDAGARFRAFASVTNNETRHVTVISPDP